MYDHENDSDKHYRAVIEIDDDRWAKNPFGYAIYDDENNRVHYADGFDDWAPCYKGIARWQVAAEDISVTYY